MNGSDAIASSRELPLLGRGRELDELMGAFEEARAGRGGLVLVTGEPGIGKTRLARALGDQARSAGAVVALARGWDGGGAPSYWPWLQVVRALAAERPDDRLAADLGSGRALGRADRARDPRPARARRGGRGRRRVRAGPLRPLRRRRRCSCAASPPTRPSSSCSTTSTPPTCRRSCCSRSSPARSPTSAVLVVSTHHDAGPSRGPEVEGIFGELSRFGRRIDLGGLEDDDLRRLVAHRTGADPSDDLVRRLAAVTEGNPFFSDEVVRLLVSHGPGPPR